MAKRQRQQRGAITRETVGGWSRRRALAKWLGVANTLFTVAAVVILIRELLSSEIPNMARETMRRMGLDYQDTDELDSVGLTAAISRTSNVHFRDITNTNFVLADIEQHGAALLSELLGVPLQSLQPGDIKRALAGSIEASFNSSNPAPILASGFIARAEKVVQEGHRQNTINEFGVGISWTPAVDRANHRAAIDRFKLTHKQVWLREELRNKYRQYVRRAPFREEFIKKMWRHNVRIYKSIKKQDGKYNLLDEYYVNHPNSPGLSWKVPPIQRDNWVGLTELNSLRRRNKLRPLKGSNYPKTHWWRSGWADKTRRQG